MTTTSAPPCASAAITRTQAREFMRPWATNVAVNTSVTAALPVGRMLKFLDSVSLDLSLLLVCLNNTSRTGVVRAGV